MKFIYSNVSKTSLKNYFNKFIIAMSIAVCFVNVSADTYPSKPIKVVIPFPPGNASDVTARALGDLLSKRIGQSVIIDNKPGAAGAIGTDFVIKSQPDGYTLLITSLSPIVILPHINKNLHFDPLKDLLPVAKIGSTSMIMVASNNFPANNLQELMSYAKNNPNKLNYASLGAGTLSMLTMEVFKKSTGLNIQHIPYKGSSQAMTDLIGGNVNLMIDGMTSSYSQVKAGKLKALSIFSSTRSEIAPEIPTLKESGNPSLADVRVDGWSGLFAPVGTSISVINFINQEINKIIVDPEFKKRAFSQNLEVYAPSSPDQFSTFIKADSDLWLSVIKPLNFVEN